MVLVLTTILFGAIIWVGRAQSKKILFALALNTIILLVTMVLMVMGFHAVWIGCLCVFGTTLVTLFYQNGWNQKTVAAFLTLVIVAIFMSVLVWFVCTRAGVYGLNERTWEEDEISILDLHVHINMLHVSYVAVLLSLIGAAKDSAIAVATGTFETFCCDPQMGRWEAFQSGMNIGKDILGVTINTLLFAAIGESLLLIQMYFDCAYSFAEFINSESLFQAAIVFLAGGIGIELSIPISAWVMSVLCTRHGNIMVP